MFVKIYDCDDVLIDYIESTPEDLISDLYAYEKELNISIGSYALYDEVNNAETV